MKRSEAGSVLILVLWIAVGLVSIALYFANSMTFELRAADNRASGLITDQAIEGAERYVGHVLANFATNGNVPDLSQYAAEAVPVGNAYFWIIGRDPSGNRNSQPYFALIDEASKMNLNSANTNALSYLPMMSLDLADVIVDWRSTNGNMSINYGQDGYMAKHSPFETVEELRLLDGMDMETLAGSDVNRNGVLDDNEKSISSFTDAGLLEYVTIYTREPNFTPDGSTLTNVNTRAQMESLLQSRFGSSRAQQIIGRLFPNNGGGTTTYSSLLQMYLSSGMTEDEFGQIYDDITVSSGTYIRGRVNVNTASEEVLNALFMGVGLDQNTASSVAAQLVTYREQNTGNLSTIAWIVDALGNQNTAVTAIARGDYLTTRSYQFTADIAAVGPFGRGYRRVKFVFDTSDGAPKIIYRQDLSRLGWALGNTVRETLLAKETQ